ncbi:MAG: repeat-like domain [Thermoleophilaceae bacterium]|nr:repeat-like domain [Thermoleophilaceae bacterium]
MKRFAALLLAALAALAAVATAQAAPKLHFKNVKVQRIPGDGGLPWAEPRNAVGPDGWSWVVTNRHASDGAAIVLGSKDGLHWKATSGLPAGQTAATPDVDILAMPTGRLLASELDDAGINFPTSWSDDRGKHWTASTGSTQVADQDRQWFAYGPPEPGSKKPVVYLLFHNLASGQANHNMFVAKSTDGGESFGVPVPTTLPGSDAYTDLQCADSGGPSAIWVNQHDGTVYAEFTTRASPVAGTDIGGCGTIATGQPFEFNIVAATRVWLAQSTDGGQTWTNSLAVDDAETGQIVSMQVASGGLDRAGNVYVAYPEGPLGREYPDYSGAGVKYKWARPAKGGNFKWSDARTLVAADKKAPGNVLVHMQAGDPGRLMTQYWRGQKRPGKKPVWHMFASMTRSALSSKPKVVEKQISKVPTDTGTASDLMGACTSGTPIAGIINGLACGRSPDVWGLVADHRCRAETVWPAVDTPDDPDASGGKKIAGNNPGTWVSKLTSGDTLCGPSRAKPLFPGGCPDRTPPLSHYRSKNAVTLRNQVLTVRGGASDKGCISANLIPGTGRVKRVDVSVAKIRGDDKTTANNCRFLTKRGTLTKSWRNCRNPILRRAKGGKKWRIGFRFPATLPKGSWRIRVRATDQSGNRELPPKFFRLTVN